MSRTVSIVIPARQDVGHFERNLPALMDEVERRGEGDEVLVVDDTGEDELRPWFAEHHPGVNGVVHSTPRGHGKAQLSGAWGAKGDFVLFLAPEIRVREGFLEPLVARLEEDPDVLAVSPVVEGECPGPEGAGLLVESALARLGTITPAHDDERALPSVHPSAFLMRREQVQQILRVEEVFEPTFVEPLERCLGSWSRGKRIVEEPRSKVEWDAGEPSDDRDRTSARIADEKNRLLSLWLNLDDAQGAREHVEDLWRSVLDPDREDWRAVTTSLVLALDHVGQLASAGERAASEQGTRPAGS